MTNLSTTTPVAKKEHRCGYCNGIISVGEKYERQANVHDGDFYEWKAHISCGCIASELNMYDDACDGVNDDFFIESINEEYANLMSEHHMEEWESLEFKHPKFQEKLKFVKNHYKIY